MEKKPRLHYGSVNFTASNPSYKKAKSKALDGMSQVDHLIGAMKFKHAKKHLPENLRHLAK